MPGSLPQASAPPFSPLPLRLLSRSTAHGSWDSSRSRPTSCPRTEQKRNPKTGSGFGRRESGMKNIFQNTTVTSPSCAAKSAAAHMIEKKGNHQWHKQWDDNKTANVLQQAHARKKEALRTRTQLHCLLLGARAGIAEEYIAPRPSSKRFTFLKGKQQLAKRHAKRLHRRTVQ